MSTDTGYNYFVIVFIFPSYKEKLGKEQCFNFLIGKYLQKMCVKFDKNLF